MGASPSTPVPELPDEIERMIHAYRMLERDRERRLEAISEFSNRSLHKAAIRMWSLADFCDLVDHKPFQEWLTNEYLNGKPSKRARLIEAVDRVYKFYMQGKVYVSDTFREELTAKYEPVVEERRRLGFKEYGVDREAELLLRMFESLRYLCQESAIVDTNKFARRQYYDPNKTRPRNRFSRLR